MTTDSRLCFPRLIPNHHIPIRGFGPLLSKLATTTLSTGQAVSLYNHLLALTPITPEQNGNGVLQIRVATHNGQWEFHAGS